MNEINPEHWRSICKRALQIYDQEIESARKPGTRITEALLLNRKMWEDELIRTEERIKRG